MSSKLSAHILRAVGDTDRLFAANPPVVLFHGDWGMASSLPHIPYRIGVRENPRDAQAQYNAGMSPEDAVAEWLGWHLESMLLDSGITHWSGHNEPNWTEIAEMQWYSEFEEERVRRMAQHGLKAALGGFATGTPPLHLWEYFLPAIATGIEHDAVLNLHEYGGTYMWWMTGPHQIDPEDFAGTPYYWHGWTTLRYRQVYDLYLKPSRLVIPLVIGEAGLDNVGPVPDGWPVGPWQVLGDFWARDKGRPDTDKFYIEQLEWYDRMLRSDDYVIGATVFSWGNFGSPWHEYDIANRPSEIFFLEYLEQEQDTDPGIPIPPLPPPGEETSFRNWSFEDGTYSPEADLNIPNEWVFEYDTGETGGGEPWDVYQKPHVNVVDDDPIDGEYNLSVTKGNAPFRVRFRQVVDLAPGEYDISIPHFFDTYFWVNGEKVWSTDPESAQIRLSWGTGSTGWVSPVPGYWQIVPATFITEGGPTEFIIEAHCLHALDHNGFYADAWILENTAEEDIPFEEALWQDSVDTQVLSLNPDAALQSEIFAQSYVPVISEASTTFDDSVYVLQAGEHLGGLPRKVYYVIYGQYDEVYYFTTPSTPLEQHLWDVSVAIQIEEGIQLNPNAAIQRVIFADDMTPVGGEEWMSHDDGPSFPYQAAEDLEDGTRIVYYAENADFSNIVKLYNPYEPPPPDEGGFRLQVWPATSWDINQWWARNPEHYGQWGLPGHDGIDFKARTGQPIYAAAGGRVYRVHTNPNSHNYGIHVRIEHHHEGQTYRTIYAHLSDHTVSEGQIVSAGHIIGLAGNTGNSSGPHLHFGLKKDGETYVDPNTGEEWPHNLHDPWPYLEHLLYGRVKDKEVGYLWRASLDDYEVEGLTEHESFATEGNMNFREGPGTGYDIIAVTRSRQTGIFVGPVDNGYRPTRMDITAGPGTGDYEYRGRPVTFSPGIHGPGSDWMWHDTSFRNTMTELDMPVKFTSNGSNIEFFAIYSKPFHLVRIWWQPSEYRSPEQAYREHYPDIQAMYNRGARMFELPQNEANLPEEGLGIVWDNGDEFGRWLSEYIDYFRADFSDVLLYYPGMSPGVPWTNQFAFTDPAWVHVEQQVDGFCLHAYTGTTNSVNVAIGEVTQQVYETQTHLNLQVPMIISEVSVNRAATSQYKADVYRGIDAELANKPGIEGLFYFVSWWQHHPEWQENWHGSLIPLYYTA